MVRKEFILQLSSDIKVTLTSFISIHWNAGTCQNIKIVSTFRMVKLSNIYE